MQLRSTPPPHPWRIAAQSQRMQLRPMQKIANSHGSLMAPVAKTTQQLWLKRWGFDIRGFSTGIHKLRWKRFANFPTSTADENGGRNHFFFFKRREVNTSQGHWESQRREELKGEESDSNFCRALDGRFRGCSKSVWKNWEGGSPKRAWIL